MRCNTLFAAATVLLPALTLAAPTNIYGLDDLCVKGVRVIVARGSATPQDAFGPINQMGAFVKAGVPNSMNHNLVYPATFENYEYSVSSGVTNLTNRIHYHTNECPNQRFVLIGYSQGAQVVADTLIGLSGTRGQGLEPQYRDNIVAIVQFGDPQFVPGFGFDAGTAYTPGVIARDNTDQYVSYGYANKMRSYCDIDDLYCASGSSVPVHLDYFNKYMGQAQEWILSMI